MSAITPRAAFFFNEAKTLYYAEAHTRYYSWIEMEIAKDIALHLFARGIFPADDVSHHFVAAGMMYDAFVWMGIWK